MIDFITNQPIVVNGEPLDGAYVIVPQAQMAAVGDAFTRDHIQFWVAEDPIVIGNEPPVMWVQLSRSAVSAHVQRVLDSL